MTNKDRILVALLKGRRIVRNRQFSWQFEKPSPSKVSLNNVHVVPMFRTGLVYVEDNALKLTERGEEQANKALGVVHES